MFGALCGIYSIGKTAFVRPFLLAYSQWSTLHQQAGQILILSDQGKWQLTSSMLKQNLDLRLRGQCPLAALVMCMSLQLSRTNV